jgi:hypothetical protein
MKKKVMGGGLLSFRLDEHAGKWLPHTELLLLGCPKMQIKSTYPSKSLKSAKTITACGLSQRLWESQADVQKGNTIWETDLIFCFYKSNNSLAYWLTQK